MTASNHKVRRTKEIIRQEQAALVEKAKSEIDALVTEFHAQLPRHEADSTGSIYARFSTRFQDSIADQVRTLFEEAIKEGIYVSREHVYFDVSTRGNKDRRPGFIKIRKAVQRLDFQVLLTFTTSRLFRKFHRTVQFVEEEMVERGMRAIFLKSNLDTANDAQWLSMLKLRGLLDDLATSLYGPHIQAAHEGLLIRGMVYGSLSLGYTGEDVPGEFTNRQRPRQRIIIDPKAALWVKFIFDEFVNARKSLDQIAQELNDDPSSPPPNKSITGMWTHNLVRQHLQRLCYRGFLIYGAEESRWNSRKDYTEQIPRDKPLKSIHHEELRIISDELWYRAQKLLDEERSNSGRKSKDGNHQPRPRMLRGLFVCPEHDRRLIVSGAHGGVLICPYCRAVKANKRPLFTYLNRALALRLTCQKLAEVIRADEELVTRVVTVCQQQVEKIQRPNPETLKRLGTQAKKLTSTIAFNRRNPGETEDEQHRTEKIIKDLRRELVDVKSQFATIEANRDRVISVPTHDDVATLLTEMGQLLERAATAETDEQVRVARQIIDELTGGRIELFQMGERKAQRGWLQGRFQLDIFSQVICKLTGARHWDGVPNRVEVVIDYVAADPMEELSEQAKQLWDQGLRLREIAKEMNSHNSTVTKLIHFWFDTHNLPRPDNHRRRTTLVKKQTKTPQYKRIANDVMERVEQGFSNLSISKQLVTSDATIAKAIKWWHKSRGLPGLTAKERRRKILQRAKEMFDKGVLLKDIATEINYTPRGLKLALKKYCAEIGEAFVDGRTRRGNASVGEFANGTDSSGKSCP